MTSLFESLDEILGAPSRVKLIRALISGERKVSAREAARIAGVSQRPALRSLHELRDMGILNCEETPLQHLYSINLDNYLVREGLATLFRIEREANDEVYRTVRTALARLPVDSVAATFGDVVREGGTARRDLSLMVVVTGESAKKSAWQSLMDHADDLEQKFGVLLTVSVFTAGELRARQLAGDALILRMMERSTLLAGRTLAEVIAPEIPESNEPLETVQGVAEEEAPRRIGKFFGRARPAGVARLFGRG